MDHNAISWHSRSAEEVAEILSTRTGSGLPPEEAASRLAEHGPNELPSRAGPGLASLLREQLGSFLVLLLIAAAAVSFFLREYVDGALIVAIVVLNAALGVSQQARAERALQALHRLAAPTATVVRGGRRLQVPARELVPGDLVILDPGDFVPADLRLVESHNLKVDEAALTGESVPVDKEAGAVFAPQAALGNRRNSAFSGTVVTYGRGCGLVVATGRHTELGLIAGMLQAVETEPTPLQRALQSLGKVLGLATVAVCATVFAVGLLRGGDLLDLFMISVSLAVAAVPEGLPAVVTIVLAMGMTKMVARHVICRRLPAVETLGSTTVICSDKTGTLTRNQMTIVRLWTCGGGYAVTGEGYRPVGEFTTDAGRSLENPLEDGLLERCLLVGTLCNDAGLVPSGEAGGEATWRITGDPTEAALVAAAHKAGLPKETAEARLPRVAEVPFDATRKRMSTLHRTPDGRLLVCAKGAPDILLRLCRNALTPQGEVELDGAARDKILSANRAMANDALRVLAFAYKVMDATPAAVTPEAVERDLVFAGLAAMIDPVRPEAVAAVATCRRAGITPIMVTGDYRDTAVAVGRVLSLSADPADVIAGEELASMSAAELARRARTAAIYARVAPKDKVRIVDALKTGSGHVVAMTGDGVNDAPALKRADIGIAMGVTGTDVAKETADMVLTDDNFASIVAAVEEGRRIFANIRKFVFFLLSCNAGEVLIVFLAMIAGLPLPLRPIHLLWLNLVTDSLPALALGLEPAEKDVMARPPRDPKEPVINRRMVRGIAMQAAVEAGATLAAFAWAWRSSGDLALSQTMAFATLVVAELIRAHASRSDSYTVLQLGLTTNRHMVWASLVSFGLLLAAIYLAPLRVAFRTVVLGWGEWAVAGGLALLPALMAELGKLAGGRGPLPPRRERGFRRA